MQNMRTDNGYMRLIPFSTRQIDRAYSLFFTLRAPKFLAGTFLTGFLYMDVVADDAVVAMVMSEMDESTDREEEAVVAAREGTFKEPSCPW